MRWSDLITLAQRWSCDTDHNHIAMSRHSPGLDIPSNFHIRL